MDKDAKASTRESTTDSLPQQGSVMILTSSSKAPFKRSLRSFSARLFAAFLDCEAAATVIEYPCEMAGSGTDLERWVVGSISCLPAASSDVPCAVFVGFGRIGRWIVPLILVTLLDALFRVVLPRADGSQDRNSASIVW